MEPGVLLFIIISITVVTYVVDQILDYVNLKAQRTDIPKEIEVFYEREKYLKSLAYHRELTKFSFLTSGVSFLISIVMLVTGGFGWVDSLFRPYFDSEIVLALVFLPY